ncbi:glycosyltransferase [Sabulicella glaciei]|uniref:Glycosyl transferase family 2 n=1 Tax=Sabulicella glaciei TaxID=2984948 RepID=A0ABT3NXY9_9PROT|nr:glycosyltransferase [Roseococcus sp. MDT2-1-1]MCW8087030.1 glycosyl transferase family 2 [Roseococcus sp. MDT2-1-1]
MNISAVIPCLNAASVTPPKEVEEVVLALPHGAAPHPRWRSVHAPRGRGLQLRTGAEAARGDWLLFLHADTRLAPNWRRAAEAALRDEEAAGYFRFALDDDAPAARRLARAVAWRCRVLALPYGDQGLLIPRALYDAVGGFRPLPLMEDVDLVRRLGRARLRALDAEAVTSAARWRRDGYLRRSSRNLVVLGLWFAGVGEERLRRFYERGGGAGAPSVPPQ